MRQRSCCFFVSQKRKAAKENGVTKRENDRKKQKSGFFIDAHFKNREPFHIRNKIVDFQEKGEK